MPDSLFDRPRNRAWERYAAHLSGGRAALFCVVSSTPLMDISREALTKAAEALGYQTHGTDADLAFVSVEDPETEAEIGVQATALLLETLDPLCLVATDHAATELVAQAYRARISIGVPTEILGRPTRCFEDFAALMATKEGKRKAWNLLKTLPKR